MNRIYNKFLQSDGVSIDTRTLKKGEMFFALSGENTNGNEFAEIALKIGASFVVITDRSIRDERAIYVEDTLVALQDLASFHRGTLDIPIIGITGSNGKTTTKELIQSVLSKRFNVVSTLGNFNNHIGVPLSVLRIHKKTEIAVIEMGANHIGEIKELCHIARPTHGLITNIGKAHLEGFGSFDNVKIAKSELFTYLSQTGGIAFVNVTEKYLESLSSHVTNRVLYEIDNEGQSKFDIEYTFGLKEIKDQLYISLLQGSDEEFTFLSDLYGTYNLPNIAAAVVLGLHFSIPIDDIYKGVKEYMPSNNRSQVVIKEGRTILLDAYNANPTSMEHAILDFAGRAGRKNLILGGMNELGGQSQKEHKKLLDLVSNYQWERVVIIGEHFMELKDDYKYDWYKSVQSFQGNLGLNPMPLGTVLIKGSRGLKLESILPYV